MINKGTTANPLVMTWLRDLFWLSAIYNFRITAVYISGVVNLRADCLPRMHNGPALLELYSYLCQDQALPTVASKLLVDHMSPISAHFLTSRFGSGLQGA